MFTNGCKKTIKLVHIALKIILKRLVLEMGFKDINAMNVIENLVPKDDLETYKKSSLKSMFIGDKY